MTDTDPPTVAERYQRATHSSHLRLQEQRGDVDYLIAAGWLRDGLGALMYRLRQEFDLVRESVRKGALNQTERLLVLSQLKTLRSARDAFGSFAIVQATKVQFMQNDAAAASIAGRVLDVWLDPNCHHCDGRGFTGGSHRGEPTVLCRPCRGSGHRRDWIGKTQEERQFASRLLAELEQQQAHIDAQMWALLVQFDGGALEVPDDVVAGIRGRLADLRGAGAEGD